MIVDVIETAPGGRGGHEGGAEAHLKQTLQHFSPQPLRTPGVGGRSGGKCDHLWAFFCTFVGQRPPRGRTFQGVKVIQTFK